MNHGHDCRQKFPEYFRRLLNVEIALDSKVFGIKCHTTGPWVATHRQYGLFIFVFEELIVLIHFIAFNCCVPSFRRLYHLLHFVTESPSHFVTQFGASSHCFLVWRGALS